VTSAAVPWLLLIDGFDLRVDGRSMSLPLPAQRLLAFLALQRRPLVRQSAAATLWTDLDDRAAGARLRSTLWRLPAPGGERLIHADGSRLSLAPHVEVDLHVAEDDDRAHELDLVRQGGEVLAHWTDDWVMVERERFRQLRLHRLEQLADVALAEGRLEFALSAALTAVAADPLRESAHRRVMRAHLAEGNPAEALRQFDMVRRLLREELGLAPCEETRAVVAHLLGRPVDRETRHRAATRS
jgi:DNA-binding SARP family transcriptional activator